MHIPTIQRSRYRVVFTGAIRMTANIGDMVWEVTHETAISHDSWGHGLISDT